MPVIQLHDLGDQLQAKLRADAARYGRTINEHARILLVQALSTSDVDAGAEANAERPEIEHIELVVDKGPKEGQALREHTRIEYGDIKARFSSDGSTKLLGLFTRYFSCDIVDISVRGARIRSNKQLREFELLKLYFSYHGGEKITIAAKVVRIRPREGAKYDYGVQFLDVLPQGELRTVICEKVIEQKFHD